MIVVKFPKLRSLRSVDKPKFRAACKIPFLNVYLRGMALLDPRWNDGREVFLADVCVAQFILIADSFNGINNFPALSEPLRAISWCAAGRRYPSPRAKILNALGGLTFSPCFRSGIPSRRCFPKIYETATISTSSRATVTVA